MPIYRSKERGAFVFEFDRVIAGQRVRATRSLPKAWNQAQADAFDRQESARLYAIATSVGGEHHTINDAVKLYLTHRAPQLKTFKSVTQELASIFWAYNGRPLSSLADVCKAIAKSKREDGKALAPATIKNRISYLRSACRWAWKHHNLGDRDPGERVITPTVKNERHRYITREEMLRLAHACGHKPTRAMIRIAFYSGMRLGEIERARVVAGCFVLDDTKNGDRRIVPIHPRINCCLDYPKQTRFATWYHFNQARQAVGMSWLHPHDLRHSAASELINQGIDLYTVGAILGHRSAASTKRYAHLATERMGDAIRKMGRRA